jgi:hypothetical protein
LPQCSQDPFVDVTQVSWDNFASRENWEAAEKLGRLCAEKRPKLYYGWENWAWALHKQGLTEAAYELLKRVVKGLKLPGPPSGRAAWCLACFCSRLGKISEARRWLRLAETLATDKSLFHFHTLREPELQALCLEAEEFY